MCVSLQVTSFIFFKVLRFLGPLCRTYFKFSMCGSTKRTQIRIDQLCRSVIRTLVSHVCWYISNDLKCHTHAQSASFVHMVRAVCEFMNVLMHKSKLINPIFCLGIFISMIYAHFCECLSPFVREWTFGINLMSLFSATVCRLFFKIYKGRVDQMMASLI